MARLHRLFGADTETRLADAKMVVAEIESPSGLSALFTIEWLGQLAELISQLALHGMRLREVRNGKR